WTKLKERSKSYLPTPSDRGAQSGAATVPDKIPTARESIPNIILELRSSPWYTGQIVPGGHRVFEPQPAVYGDLNFRLSQDLVNALYNSRGIVQLYGHQAEALNSLSSGNNVVVATSTSSGKSLIYQLPVLHALEQDLSTRAMYIFPTKALAQDQKRNLSELLHYMPQLKDVLVATFDGDTPRADRVTIREEARIIFTNPDMLHMAILPHEERWRKYLQHLKYVVGKPWLFRRTFGIRLTTR
ncbi:DEAD/DEAH box helicase, partial [Candidatus Bathyarchaeota archaeon]|nr:DEAD/DEAH box helicase [Candidatus Bathyarchaeota archaeon]